MAEHRATGTTSLSRLSSISTAPTSSQTEMKRRSGLTHTEDLNTKLSSGKIA